MDKQLMTTKEAITLRQADSALFGPQGGALTRVLNTCDILIDAFRSHAMALHIVHPQPVDEITIPPFNNCEYQYCKEARGLLDRLNS